MILKVSFSLSFQIKMGKRNNAGGNGEQGPSAPSKVLRSTPSSSSSVCQDCIPNLYKLQKGMKDLEQIKRAFEKLSVLIKNVKKENESLKEENESLKQEINMLKQNQVDSKPNKEEQSDKVMKNEKSEEMQSQLDEVLTSKMETIVRGPVLKLKK